MKMKTKTITKQAMADFKLAIKNWRTHPRFKDDNDMKKLYIKDRKELTQVYRMIEKGLLKEAGEKAYDMDTVVRDEIPKSIYNIIA